MAAKGEENVLTVESSGDLSSDQYKYVELDGSAQAQVVGTQGNVALGILENKPSSQGEAATVRFNGTGKVIAGESITAGDEVASDASGKAITADTSTDKIQGQAITDADSGDVFKVTVDSSGQVA
jgi:hypothetical protein